jgi:hypothetical protein
LAEGHPDKRELRQGCHSSKKKFAAWPKAILTSASFVRAATPPKKICRLAEGHSELVDKGT